MSQFYFDPKREDEPTALPDAEVFYHNGKLPEDGGTLDFGSEDEPDNPLPAGWYWWACFPGCLPDGDPVGPFATRKEAMADAREGMDHGTV